MQGLKKEFEKIDTDHSGFLEMSEIVKAIDDGNFDLTSEEI